MSHPSWQTDNFKKSIFDHYTKAYLTLSFLNINMKLLVILLVSAMRCGYDSSAVPAGGKKTCKQGQIHSYLPPTFPFPLEIKQEYCFCIIVVPWMKTILFEKFATVFKHKISTSEGLHSKHTSTFKLREAAQHLVNCKLLF